MKRAVPIQLKAQMFLQYNNYTNTKLIKRNWREKLIDAHYDKTKEPKLSVKNKQIKKCQLLTKVCSLSCEHFITLSCRLPLLIHSCLLTAGEQGRPPPPPPTDGLTLSHPHPSHAESTLKYPFGVIEIQGSLVGSWLLLCWQHFV